MDNFQEANGLKFIRIYSHFVFMKPLATFYFNSNFYFKPLTFVAILLKILSSANLCAEAIKINNKQLLKNKLKKVGPTIEVHLILYFVSYFFRYLFGLIATII